MKLYSINTGYFKLDGGAMFGVVPKSIWNKLNPADDNNMCNWAMRCLLIEDGNKLILIDNGMGDKQDAKFFGHYYLNGDDSLDKSLAKHGFNKDDVTDVILTHLHFDHCGGSIKREGDKLVPAFKNASFWSNKAHWQWATEPNDREKASFLEENILPIKDSGQLKMVKSNHQMAANKLGRTSSEILPSISFLFANGHTESMMLPLIEYNDRRIVFMADLLPAVAHIPLPYVMAYDMFPLTTLQEKKSFLNEAMENKYTLFFEHDPNIECCNLQITEKGIRQGDTFRIQDIG
ncbi:MBL fold metallo-hydrolase [Ferruginibacter albus]|uniref:MBL fold metallo-hydrolase n=1 Tax=Ferruginibacter albus TaxID=2875540 RepID=UPI001CC56F56|nr:MBL fold metallo-hydrolase [Ferruginibacter albus]UAY51797.1 MBL fold metallo-hydrolase [Ferruginibacter albus]